MGVKDDFSGSSILGKVNLIVLLVANFCNWIAFCTAEWGKNYASVNDYNLNIFNGWGLWRICGNTLSNAGCNQLDGWALDWYGAVQAFAIFAFVGINVAFLLVVLMMFTSKCKGNGDAGMASAILCLVAAVCYLIAVIIFAYYFSVVYTVFTINLRPVGYSLILAIIALILAFVSGILIIVDLKKGGSTSPA
ncbi:epithelial membrane protein 1-like [Patella vulgata]|uniref:epithelial membrane protein 1-like n=1 Tax=Patella vulgata TaxID=6465 RepID=UPI0024A9553D|nr:epithelial membrane protein 1-like [Patella vulgata]